jgi:Zn-dependent peptidase ImmA (M78 family)
MTAKELLEYLSERHNFSVDPPIDLFKIAKLLNINIVYSNLSNSDIVGKIIKEEANTTIEINMPNNRYEARKRFTLAHEIGHFCLHQDIDGFVDDKKSLNRIQSHWNSYEIEANQFAAELLMPTELLLKHGKIIIAEYKENNDNANIPKEHFIDQMARMFNVSHQAMKYRLINLELIKPD